MDLNPRATAPEVRSGSADSSIVCLPDRGADALLVHDMTSTLAKHTVSGLRTILSTSAAVNDRLPVNFTR